MKPDHDTLRNLARGTPFWFTASGWLVPVGVLGQVVLAGGDGSPRLAYHPANGALMPVASLVLCAKIERRRAHVHATKGSN